MGRGITIGAFQVTERDMRDWEWSESFMASRHPYRSDPRAGLKYLEPKRKRA